MYLIDGDCQHGLSRIISDFIVSLLSARLSNWLSAAATNSYKASRFL